MLLRPKQSIPLTRIVYAREDLVMTSFRYRATAVVFLAALSLSSLRAQTAAPRTNEAAATARAAGPFDVKVTQQEDKTDPLIGRYIFDKQFHGDLEATSKGEMLSSGGTKGTGGYVAIEIVTGKLGGRAGTFALQHTGSMIDNAFTLVVTVVPGSGTGELTGLTGKMNILIAAGGKHSYDFEYTLPAK
jgi:hypothetical protein